MIEDEAAGGRSHSFVLSQMGKEVLDQAEQQWEKAQTELETIIGVDQLQHLVEIENKLCELPS
jgi:hypothetical protein